MPQSLSRIALHIVFGTKGHRLLIAEDVADDLFAYIAGILQKLECPPILINGAEDHVHILCVLSRNMAVAGLVKELKIASSKWIKTQSPEYEGFKWQSGYGVFSVSHSAISAVSEYIKGQGEHHRKVSFKDEFRAFLAKHNIDYDERFVWD